MNNYQGEKKAKYVVLGMLLGFAGSAAYYSMTATETTHTMKLEASEEEVDPDDICT